MLLIKASKKFLFACTLLCAGVVTNAIAADLSPLGNWQTIDDETSQPRSIIAITETQGKIEGTIEKVFYRAGEGPNDVCKECSGDKHNQKILGLVIMWNLADKGHGLWSDGTIVDPSNGKTYKCQLSMAKDGKTMTVRGYIGMPLFGRSQTWIRMPV